MSSQATQGVDYYACLGAPADASLAEIKNAYRTLVKCYHPDVYTFDDLAGRRKAELAMRQINEAYAILSDNEERRRYDKYFQASIVTHMDTLSRDTTMDTETKFETESHPDWSGIVRRLLNNQRVTARERPAMGVFRKALLVPIPFCMATAASAAFWNLSHITGAMFLGGLTAVLSYPLILLLLLLRLVAPIRHTPLLTMKQRLICLPVVMMVASFLGYIWFAMVDHSGITTTQWDLCWWCGLIGITFATLAYL
jgi:hypothetical protein